LTATVRRLCIYPVKSCGGIDLTEMRLDRRGPLLDRHWLIVDETGLFVTQRQCAKLATVHFRIDGQRLVAECPDNPPLDLADISDWSNPRPLGASLAERLDVKIWKESVNALRWSAPVDEWFSNIVGRPCRLVAADAFFSRQRIKGSPPREFSVKFPHSAPVLLINRSSVEALKQFGKLERTHEDQFRANVIVDGLSVYAEDDFKRFTIGNLRFPVVYPCDRCKIININQMDGTSSADTLLALSRLRQSQAASLFFGIRAVHADPGIIRVGDSVAE
jgi:uncharacterized protein YcbX